MKIDFSKNTLIITLYNRDDVSLIWNTIEEMERKLCKKLNVDEDYLEEFNEIHIDVYQNLRQYSSDIFKKIKYVSCWR